MRSQNVRKIAIADGSTGHIAVTTPWSDFTPNERKTASHRRGLLDLFFTDLFTAPVAMDSIARAAVWTNQMGYMTQPSCQGVNRPSPRAQPEDKCGYVAINARQLGYNYYISLRILSLQTLFTC